nr:MAG TPA: Major capsid protein [Microviridae sp.]
MSDFNPLVNKSIPTHRSGFDMSEKKMFTAKVGELLPVMWQYGIPGDVFEISEDWFTRTRPVNTSAYTRIREYYDFYAVPLRLLNRNLPTAFAQMSDYAVSAINKSQNSYLMEDVPNVSQDILEKTFTTYLKSTDLDDAGFPIRATSQKLLNYLNYGAIDSNVSESSMTSWFTTNPTAFKSRKTEQFLSVLPLCAYQKIYFDFYSNSQWERHLAYSYNTDYMLQVQAFDTNLDKEMIKLRYANYNKDYFMGVLPNSQYGDVAMVQYNDNTKYPVYQTSSSFPNSYNSIQLYSQSDGTISAQGDLLDPKLNFHNNETVPNKVAKNAFIYAMNPSLQSNISFLAIRAAEYLQRWKEVVQFSSKDYNDQMKAQFGVRGDDSMGNHAHYIGGFDGNIDISEVVNTNLDTEGSQANIAGKGVGSGRSRKIRYTVGAEHCIIMCIYHAVPLVDYNIDGADPQLQRIAISDFPQPAFDSLGMESVPLTALTASAISLNEDSLLDYFVGYSLRYPDFKTRIDRISGAFQTTLKNWVAPINWLNILTAQRGQGAFNYLSFKVRPSQLDPIFDVQANEKVDTDQLLCNAQFNIKVARNLSRDGLPY